VSRDPTTPEEWQAVVDGAYVMLIIEKARGYGFVDGGGPTVNVARCEDVLARGRALGYRPKRSVLAVAAEGFSLSSERDNLLAVLESVADEGRA